MSEREKMPERMLHLHKTDFWGKSQIKHLHVSSFYAILKLNEVLF